MDYDFSPEGLEALEAVRKRIDERRQKTAYHESGHAVMAEYLGYPILKVSILPEGRTNGRCCREAPVYDGLGETEARTQAVDNVLICFAGHAAESLLHGHHAPHTIDYIASNGGDSDCKKAWALLPKIVGGLDADATRKERENYDTVCRAYLNYQVARAYKVIRSEPLRTVVKVLALELLGWDELSGEEAREVMLKALNSKSAGLPQDLLPVFPRSRAG